MTDHDALELSALVDSILNLHTPLFIELSNGERVEVCGHCDVRSLGLTLVSQSEGYPCATVQLIRHCLGES